MNAATATEELPTLHDPPDVASDWFAAGLAFGALSEAIVKSAANAAGLDMIERILRDLHHSEIERIRA